MYDVLVDRSGGDGQGQYRTDRAGSIGKISTGRTLQEELRASELVADRQVAGPGRTGCRRRRGGASQCV